MPDRPSLPPSAAPHPSTVWDGTPAEAGERPDVTVDTSDAPARADVAAAAAPAALGRAGRYELLGEIGRGGMGQVLRGRDPALGREVALKVLLGHHAQEPGVVQRFREEAQIGGQL